MPVNDKRCRKCGQTKPLRFFTLPRHRLCTRCRTHSQFDLVEEFVADQADVAASPSAAQLWLAQQPGVARPGGPVPALTMSWEGVKKYNRERARQIRIEQEQQAIADGHNVHTPTYRKVKSCVRCKERKHVTMFRSPRYRICSACDGPPLT